MRRIVLVCFCRLFDVNFNCTKLSLPLLCFSFLFFSLNLFLTHWNRTFGYWTQIRNKKNSLFVSKLTHKIVTTLHFVTLKLVATKQIVCFLLLKIHFIESRRYFYLTSLNFNFNFNLKLLNFNNTQTQKKNKQTKAKVCCLHLVFVTTTRRRKKNKTTCSLCLFVVVVVLFAEKR